MPSRAHEHRVDLDTLISEINEFPSFPIPETLEECTEMHDRGYLLRRELNEHFRFYLDARLDTDEKSSIFDKGLFLSKEAKEELSYFEKLELPELTDKLRGRCEEFYERFLGAVDL